MQTESKKEQKDWAAISELKDLLKRKNQLRHEILKIINDHQNETHETMIADIHSTIAKRFKNDKQLSKLS